jgi:AcrR family transcriptional regulator
MPTPRDRLLTAAREVVAKDGLEGLTLRAIARQAGVSHGAPLRHFPTLAALLAAVAADGFDRLVDAVDGAIARADAAAAEAGRTLRAVDRLAIGGRAYVDVALADPGVFSITFRPERCDIEDAEYQRQADRSFGQLVGLVEAAQAEGWHPGESPVVAAGVLWANVHGVAELALHGGLEAVLGPDPIDTLWPVACRLIIGDDIADPGRDPGRDPHPNPYPGQGGDI